MVDDIICKKLKKKKGNLRKSFNLHIILIAIIFYECNDEWFYHAYWKRISSKN